MLTRSPRVLIGIFVLFLLLSRFGAATAPAQTSEADVFVEQAIVDYQDKRYDAALAGLNRALQIEPRHAEALYYSGLVRMAQGKTAEAIPFLERARAAAPTDGTLAYQLGLAYFSQEQYDKAAPPLESAFKTDPNLPNLGYYVGFLRYRDKDYQGALRAFRAARVTDARFEQLRQLYSAMALVGLGASGQATAELERSIQIAPGSAITGPAERLRDAIIAARGAERPFSVELRTGAFHDDNTAVVPERSMREPLNAILRRRNHESFGAFLGFRGDYRFFRSDAWDAAIGYSFFGTHYFQTPSFDLTNHLASATLTRKTVVRGMPLQLSGQFAWDEVFVRNQMFVRRNTLSASASLVESERHLTQIVGRYQSKDFGDPMPKPIREEIRDGNNWMIGGLHVLRFAQDRHLIKFGYQFDYDETIGRDWEYRGHRLIGGGQYTLPWWGIRLKDDLDVHLREYLHKHTILPSTDPNTKRRRDQEITNVARVEYPVPLHILRGDVLTVAGEYMTVFGESNIKVFDYRRNIVSLILSWAY